MSRFKVSNKYIYLKHHATGVICAIKAISRTSKLVLFHINFSVSLNNYLAAQRLFTSTLCKEKAQNNLILQYLSLEETQYTHPHARRSVINWKY